MNDGIQLKKIEKKSGEQKYHVNALVNGKVVYDSAFSLDSSIRNQLLAAVDEYLHGEDS